MKVIVAARPPIDESNDYFATVEGELVMLPALQCDCPDCGCDRGFGGLASARATSTAMVVNLPGMTTARLRDALFDSLHRQGWLECLSATEADDLVAEQLADIRRICRNFPSGTLLRRHNQVIWNCGTAVA